MSCEQGPGSPKAYTHSTRPSWIRRGTPVPCGESAVLSPGRQGSPALPFLQSCHQGLCKVRGALTSHGNSRIISQS